MSMVKALAVNLILVFVSNTWVVAVHEVWKTADQRKNNYNN